MSGIDDYMKMAKVQMRRIRHNHYRVHEEVYPNPYPKELMLRNHVWAQALLMANCRDSHGSTLLRNDRDERHSSPIDHLP
jgi:hypothetical protein